MGKQTFNIKGMMRDLDPAKSPNQYAYEIRNLRLTAQEDTTMLALVSEKGNLQYLIKDITGAKDYDIVGNIVGYCILGIDKLILFTHDSTNGDNIYILREYPNNIMHCECLYGYSYAAHQKDLGFTNDTVIEAIGIYENEDIQRVYWVDGVHQPRSINIVAEDVVLTKWDLMTICPFDFMMEMRLEEAVTINHKSDIFGTFPAGTIQYVLSYYSENGQRTPSFYVSSLYYTSVGIRGASPEEKCSGSFEVKIANTSIDTNFDYVSIYSIQRTSMNGTPICKKVVDLKISEFTGQPYITYIDNGLSSETVDYSEILYLGGSNIVPYTMEQKNNTLFFGNIQYNDFIIDANSINIIADDSTISFDIKNAVAIAESNSTYYPYASQICPPNQVIPGTTPPVYFTPSGCASYVTTFKFGESYYFGIILQNKYGQWSNVIPISTKVGDKYQRTQNPYTPQYATDENLFTPTQVTITFGQDALDELTLLGCKKIKVVRMNESPQILCQGVLCPTIFSKDRKISNGSNYAQSSWYFRPVRADGDYIEDNKVQYYHNMNLRFIDDKNCNEIQGSSKYSLDYYYMPNIDDFTPMDMFVDWNILTLHSPDIEFGDVSSYNNIPCDVRIVGVVPIEYGITSMFLDLDSPAHSPIGRYEPLILSDTNYNDNNAPVCLSNFYYIDNTFTNGAWSNPMKKYMVFPWHRFSSLSSQTTPSTDDEWYGKLGRKCMATLRSSFRPLYEDDALTNSGNTLEATDFKYVNNINSSVSIPADANCDDNIRIYHSNIDRVLAGNVENYGMPLGGGNVEKLSEESSSIRMSYKSSTHGVFSLKYDSNHKQTILPETTRPISRSNDYPVNFLAKVIIANPVDFTANVNISTYGSSFELIRVKKSYANTTIISGLAGDSIVFRVPYNPSLDYSAPYENLYVILSDEDATSGAGYDATNYPISDWYYIKKMRGQDIIDYHIHEPLPDDTDPNKDWYYVFIYVYPSNQELYNYFFPNGGPEDSTGTVLYIYKIFVLSTTPSAYSIGNLEYVDTITYSTHYEELSDIEIPDITDHKVDFLYLADLVLHQDRAELNSFEGTTWVIAGRAVNMPATTSTSIHGDIGDTYFQRYDCLKTMPYSNESQNQIVDILSFMCETRINIEGRYDTKRGMANNTLVNETNFNQVNIAYSQIDNFFTPQYLGPDENNVTYFPNQIVWTFSKVYGSKIDNWAHIIPTSSLNLNGNLGHIKSLNIWNDNLMCFQDIGISKIMYNERTTMSTEQGIPVEIANSGKVDGSHYISNQIGCSNKKSIKVTQEGIYFIDSNTREIYKWNQGIESLSKSKGFNTYFYNKSVDINNIKTFYDPKLKDVYFRINKGMNTTECLVYNEQLGEFTSFFDYDMDFLIPLKDSIIAIEHNSGNLWKQFASDEYLRYFDEVVTIDNTDYPVYKDYSVELISAENPTVTKIFIGMEFRADVIDGSIVKTSSQAIETDINLQNLASINKLPFKTMRVWNEYQDTGDTTFERLVRKGANLSQKFRIWRANVARDHNDKDHHFNRIVSPWARFKLVGGGEDTKTVIHDIEVMYM